MQTAKQYGNLGRLYQTTKMFKRSEQMHLKAIKLKESLLGEEDYEVGLSLGHLASLYAYDMKEYRKAELLYLRSINISIRLFGLAYSGLKCDYFGLLQVYSHFTLCCNGQCCLKGKFGDFFYLFKVFIGPKLSFNRQFSPKAPKWVKNQAKGSKIHKIRTKWRPTYCGNPSILASDLLWESTNSGVRATVGIHSSI